MLEQGLGHQRPRVEADRAARDQVAAAHRDQVGGARPGADEMHRHRPSPVAMAQVARSRCDTRTQQRALRPRRRWPRPRDRRQGPWPPARTWTGEDLSGDTIEIHHRAGDQRDRQARQPREKPFGRLLRFGGDRLQALAGSSCIRAPSAPRASISSAESAATTAHALPRSWLPRPPLHDRRGGAPDEDAAGAGLAGFRHFETQQLRRRAAGNTLSNAPQTGSTRRWRPGARPASAQPTPPRTGRLGQPAADEHRVRRRQARQALGRTFLCTICRSGVPSTAGVASRARRALRLRFDTDRPERGMAQQPFDGDRPAPSRHPTKARPARRQGRHGDGADLALGELPVMLEQRIVEARRSGSTVASAAAATCNAMVLSGATSAISKPAAVVERTRSRDRPWPPHGELGIGPMPRSTEELWRAWPASRHPTTAPDARPGLQMAHDAL